MVKELSELTQEELWRIFPIVLDKYNTDYPSWYEEEKAKLINSIGESNIVRINHIGSTAVDGLISKPTIDILLEVELTFNTKELRKLLEDEGWILMNSQDQPFIKYVFNKGYTEYGYAEKVYHLHLRSYDSWDELYFRDYLREHDAVADEYGKLKLSLLETYRNDRDGYTDAKSEFIKDYTSLARERYKNRY